MYRRLPKWRSVARRVSYFFWSKRFALSRKQCGRVFGGCFRIPRYVEELECQILDGETEAACIDTFLVRDTVQRCRNSARYRRALFVRRVFTQLDAALCLRAHHKVR